MLIFLTNLQSLISDIIAPDRQEYAGTSAAQRNQTF